MNIRSRAPPAAQSGPASAGLRDRGAAGMDLLAAVAEPVVIAPGQRVLIPTGLAIALPPGYELQVRPRSGWRYATASSCRTVPERSTRITAVKSR